MTYTSSVPGPDNTAITQGYTCYVSRGELLHSGQSAHHCHCENVVVYTSSGWPDLVFSGIHNDCVCDDVVRCAVVLEEEDSEAHREEECQ